MNPAFLQAIKAPAVLETAERGKKVLVQQALVDYITQTYKDIDAALASIPVTLKKYNIGPAENEVLQRGIVKEGFAAIERRVFYDALDGLKDSKLFPEMREKMARQNLQYIPAQLKPDIEAIVGEVKALNKDLPEPLDLDGLWFRSGKLRVQPKFYEAVAPKYTFPVTDKDLKLVEKMRTAGDIIAELAKHGVPVADDYRIPPAGGNPIIAPGLVTLIAKGSKYTDAELLGLLLQGIQLTH